ncbi:MAG: hypothetical protein IPN71_14660 [Fibrobacteres bacterium]|nr:hypothetical protein [Fibrobacterota bacterium]
MVIFPALSVVCFSKDFWLSIELIFLARKKIPFKLTVAFGIGLLWGSRILMMTWSQARQLLTIVAAARMVARKALLNMIFRILSALGFRSFGGEGGSLTGNDTSGGVLCFLKTAEQTAKTVYSSAEIRECQR